MSSLAGRMRFVRMSRANRGGPDRPHSAASNSSARSWLCLVDIDANSLTVDARIFGSSLAMARCRRVSSTSGSRSSRARNASNESSGKSHGLGARRVTNEAKALATCPARSLCAQNPEFGADQQVRPPVFVIHELAVFAFNHFVIRPAGCQSDQRASVRAQTVAGRDDRPRPSTNLRRSA